MNSRQTGEATAPAPLPRVVGITDDNLHLPVYQDGGGLRLPLGAPAVFLDRDGVLVEDVHFLTDASDLKILRGVPEALSMLQDRYRIVVVTNQSGIARGLLDQEILLDLHSKLVRLLWAEGAMIDGLYFCPHLPEAPVAAYRASCDCRKPGPGMLLRAQERWRIDMAGSFLVGDTPRDLQSAEAAGVTPIGTGEARSSATGPAMTAPGLLEAAHLIVAAESAAAGSEDASGSPRVGRPSRQGVG